MKGKTNINIKILLKKCKLQNELRPNVFKQKMATMFGCELAVIQPSGAEFEFGSLHDHC
jgi:hypothetical protein